MISSNSAMRENKGGQEDGELQDLSFEIKWSGKMSRRK